MRYEELSPTDQMILLHEGVVLLLSERFVRYAPGNDPLGTVLHWLESNDYPFVKLEDGSFQVGKDCAAHFSKDWDR